MLLRGISVIVILFILCSIAYAEDISTDEVWGKLQKKADELYGGWNTNIQVSIGYQAGEELIGDEERGRRGPFGEIKLSVPLYSKVERRVLIDKQWDFLKRGASLLGVIEGNRRQIKVLREKAKVLWAVMKSGGVESINAYYEVLEEIADKESQITKAEREVESMLGGKN